MGSIRLIIMNRYKINVFHTLMMKWILFVVMAVPISGQDVSMLLKLEDPQYISNLNWYQNLFSVTITNNEIDTIQYRIIFSLTISNSSFISGEILTGETRVGVKKGWEDEDDKKPLPQGTLDAGMPETIYNYDNNRIE